MNSNHNALKNQVYEMFRRNAIAVFSDDILEPSALALCGVHPPATGVGLLEILFKLTRERKMVIWKDGETYGFLPIKTWRREMAAIKSPIRAECEAMRVRGGAIAQLQTTMICHTVNALLVSACQLSGKPRNNTRSRKAFVRVP